MSANKFYPLFPKLWENATKVHDRDRFDYETSEPIALAFCERLQVPDEVEIFVMRAAVDVVPWNVNDNNLIARTRRIVGQGVPGDQRLAGMVEGVEKEMAEDLEQFQLLPTNDRPQYVYAIYQPPLFDPEQGWIMRYAKRWTARKPDANQEVNIE